MNIVDIYMNNLRKDDVLNFATKKDIRLSNEELDFTYDFIKKHYKEIMQDKYLYLVSLIYYKHFWILLHPYI